MNTLISRFWGSHISWHLNFAILRKFCILTHLNFAFLSKTLFIPLSMLFNVSLNLIKQLNQQCPNKQKRNWLGCVPLGWSGSGSCSDPRSLGSWCIKGTDESTLITDLSVPLMHHDMSDLGLLIRIRITPKERTHFIVNKNKKDVL